MSLIMTTKLSFASKETYAYFLVIVILETPLLETHFTESLHTSLDIYSKMGSPDCRGILKSHML